MNALSRRALLRAKPENPAPRLPWLSEHALDRCTRCGDCIAACEEAILVKADGGFPAIDFNLGGCTACGACADSCAQSVFDPTLPLWPHTVNIGEQCLTNAGVYCQSCRDGCEPTAIAFTPASPIPLPAIDTEACTRCGMCITLCPTNAITWSLPA